MKKIREYLQYISNRMRLLMIGVFAVLVVLALTDVWYVYQKRIPTAVLILPAAAIAVFAALYIVWICRPFQKSERMRNQFLDGYMVCDKQDDSGAQSVWLTPASRRENEKINDILTSSELSNLNKRQAQYLALQNQINPHFLYNTLDGIRSEALIEGIDHVAEMTEALAAFFRYTISRDENLVSVEEELENCRIYFKIQQYRFGDRIRLIIECEEENREEILQCKIPKLTLQPILENSIIHGTELRLGEGIQTIHLMLTGSRLLIRVSDNGVGMDEKTLEELNRKMGRSADQLAASERDKKGGIALYNVNHRIHLIYGEEYGLHIFSTENIGTDVEISIPIVHSEQELKHAGASV